jgi:hypothetical protein
VCHWLWQCGIACRCGGTKKHWQSQWHTLLIDDLLS